MRARRKKGLTLIETLLALIMLSLLIVAILGLMGSLLVASTKSTDSTAGTLMAQYLFERASTVGPPEPDEGTGEQIQTGVEQLLSHEEHRAVDFQYKMVWTKIGEAETYTLGTATQESQFGPELFHVEIQVWWMVENPEDGRAEGGGRRTVTLERLISVEESLEIEE